MNTLLRSLIILLLLMGSLVSDEWVSYPWSEAYQAELVQKAEAASESLAGYLSFQYPNRDYEKISDQFVEGKIPLFAYGSLMNRASAARSLNTTAIESMQPAIAFGLKRVFNYKGAEKTHWSKQADPVERAMLNITPTGTYESIINGTIVEINASDLGNLVKREEGYDLVPLLIADWDSAINENGNIEVKIGYTFMASDELRLGTKYTDSQFYPNRGYLRAVREGASAFGPTFLDFWNATTYLGDKTTPLSERE